jgi:UDP-glucuronate 4-epimerase
MNILVTGSAGFIGFHLCKKLLSLKQIKIYGLDNINNYYSTTLKKKRLEILNKNKNFFFFKLDLKDKKKINYIVKKYKIKIIIHLAAQAGVRYSLENPKAYLDSNVIGFFNILEICKENKVEHLMFASSSSVYGANKKLPSKEYFNTDFPIQFYAATKKTNEIMAHSYSFLYNIKITGLRFFTVYGPWGRPDMAYYTFTKNIINKKKIKIFNNGNHSRDFTYIDDVVLMVTRLLFDKLKNKKNDSSFEIFNISCGQTVKLRDFLNEIEKNLQIKSKISYFPKQLGDIENTFSYNFKIKSRLNFKNFTSYKIGVKNFINWFQSYSKN